MNSKLQARIYRAPKSLAPLQAIVVRQLDAADQMEAARIANTVKALDDDEAMSNRGSEMLRISIVAVQMAGQKEPQPVEQPYAGLDGWPFTWHRFTQECFAHLNTLDPSEVGEAIAESQEWVGGKASGTKTDPGDGVLEA